MASWVDVSQVLGARGITQRNVPMRSKLLISTAALLAGIAVASAQNMPGGAQSGGAAQDKSGDKSGQAQPGSQPSMQGQRGQRGPMDQTTGKAPQEQKDQNAQGQDSPKGKAQPQRTQRDRDQTTGQGQRDQSPTQQQGQQGQAPQGQAQQGQTGGKAALTTEQRTKVRETVLGGGNVPRATNVNFSVKVGTTVPTSVRVVAVPQVLVDIYPEYRGHMYFVVGDEIIIVDRNHRIIAVIAV
jgi:Protein of unknown function (DUF1236)